MRKFSTTLLLVLIILMQSVNGQGNFKQKQTLTAIDSFILDQMSLFHVPGLSACIIKKDSVVWHNNYGYMNLIDSTLVHDSTLFNIFSIGKSLTSACAMQLWDNQLLGLDQNINDFLPFLVENSWNNADSITARMLMSHTSSIQDGGAANAITVGDPTDSLGYFLENYLSQGGQYYSAYNYYNLIPGTVVRYDNYGSALSGYLIEPLTGISFNQYARDSLLNPLEMHNSAWFLNELNINKLAVGYTHLGGGNYTPNQHLGHPAYPGMSLRASALELSNFLIMLLNEGVFNGQNILSVDAVDSMTTVQNSNGAYTFGITGLGLFRRTDYGNRKVWGHNGGGTAGYAAHFYFCEKERSGVIITTNSEQWLDPMVEYLFDYARTITNISEEPEYRNVKMNVYPNPSSRMTNINFELKWNEDVSISLRNICGQEVKYIPLGTKKSGNYELNCSEFSSGIYFITLQTNSEVLTKKLIIE